MTKASRKAAAERANILMRDAEPALEEFKQMKEDAHTQRYGRACKFVGFSVKYLHVSWLLERERENKGEGSYTSGFF